MIQLPRFPQVVGPTLSPDSTPKLLIPVHLSHFQTGRRRHRHIGNLLCLIQYMDIYLHILYINVIYIHIIMFIFYILSVRLIPTHTLCNVSFIVHTVYSPISYNLCVPAKYTFKTLCTVVTIKICSNVRRCYTTTTFVTFPIKTVRYLGRHICMGT